MDSTFEYVKVVKGGNEKLFKFIVMIPQKFFLTDYWDERHTSLFLQISDGFLL